MVGAAVWQVVVSRSAPSHSPDPTLQPNPLQDGVFHNFDTTNTDKRFCVNCHRGSLWPTWCGRRPTKQPYWDMQLCEKTVTDLAIKSAGEHE